MKDSAPTINGHDVLLVGDVFVFQENEGFIIIIVCTFGDITCLRVRSIVVLWFIDQQWNSTLLLAVDAIQVWRLVSSHWSVRNEMVRVRQDMRRPGLNELSSHWIKACT